MNVIVIHGDNKEASYKRLSEIISEIKMSGYDVRNITLAGKLSFSEEIASQDLFSKNLFVVENPRSVTKNDLKLLSKYSTDNSYIIFYQEGYLAKGFLESLPKNSKVEEYKYPKIIFKLLESFYPSNTKNTIKLLHSVMKNEPEELVLYLLAKQLRDLYWVKVASPRLSYPDWKILKLKNQSNKFTESRLKRLIAELSALDVKIKSSKENFTSNLDLIVVTLLE